MTGGGRGGSGSASAASRLPPLPGRFECRPLQISVVQSAGRPSSSSTARTVVDHRRADRLEAEFLLAPPAHPDRLPRACASRSPRHRPPRRRRRYGRSSPAPARDARRSPPDRASRSAPAPRAADRRPANASTPRACRRDTRRRRRTARSRHATMCIRVKVASRRVAPGAGSAGGAPTSRSSEGCCNSQRASSWNGLSGSTPSQAHMRRRDRRDGFDDRLVGADDRDEIAVADDLDRGPWRRGGSRPRRSTAIVAPGRGWRTTRACTMPSSVMSWTNAASPNTFAARSTRAAFCPTTVYSAAFLIARAAGGVAARDRPRRPATSNPARSARRDRGSRRRAPPDRRARTRTPRRHGRETAPAPRRRPAAARRRRTGSTGCRRYSPRSGSARCRRSASTMRAGSTSSSSAAICRIAVRTPWPISTRPVETRTLPGSGNPTHWSRRGFCCSSAGSARGRVAHRPPSSRIRAAARSTARRMRAWLPQRQILSSSARAISCPARRRVAVEQRLGGDR